MAEQKTEAFAPTPEAKEVIRRVIRRSMATGRTAATSEMIAVALVQMNPQYRAALSELSTRVAANDPGEIISAAEFERQFLSD